MAEWVMEFTGERVVEGNTPERIWSDHLARYEFAGRHVNGKLALDIACGTGYGSNLLYRSGAKHVIGVDISSETIDFACTKYKTNGVNFYGLTPVAFAATGVACPPSVDNFIYGFIPVELRRKI